MSGRLTSSSRNLKTETIIRQTGSQIPRVILPNMANTPPTELQMAVNSSFRTYMFSSTFSLSG